MPPGLRAALPGDIGSNGPGQDPATGAKTLAAAGGIPPKSAGGCDRDVVFDQSANGRLDFAAVDKCKLFCELIDGCDAWKATWDDVAYNLDLDGSLHTTYVIHDVGNVATCTSPSQIAKADIIALSFFVSEIFHLSTAKKYLVKMLSAAKSGAILLVEDNRTAKVYELIDAVAASSGYKLLDSGEEQAKIWDSGEDKAKLKVYTDKFGTASKLTGQICWRIFRKK